MKSKFSSIWRVAIALVLVLSLGLVFAAPAAAATITVGPGKTHDNITDAINAASPGDIILVYPDTYDFALEGAFPIDVDKAGLTIRSTSGAAVTIIDPAGNGRGAVEISANSVTLDGFTVKSGTQAVDGANPDEHTIWVHAEYSTISNNTIIGAPGTAGLYIGGRTANIPDGGGGPTTIGIWGYNVSTPKGHTIQDNTFRNRNAGEGWGIYAYDLTDSLIKGNTFAGDDFWTVNSVPGAPGTGIIISNATAGIATGSPGGGYVVIEDNIGQYIKYSWLTFCAAYPFNLCATDIGPGTMKEQSVDSTVDNVIVRNNTVSDIDKSNSTAVKFLPSTKDNGYGVQGADLTIGSNKVTIGPGNNFDNVYFGVGISGIGTYNSSYARVLGASNIVISKNHIYSGYVGMFFEEIHGESDANRMQVVDNCIYSNTAGIYLDSCEFINVEGNTLTLNGAAGINLNTTSGGLLYGISILSNYIADNTGQGILVGEFAAVTSVNWGGNIDISNNIIAGNVDAGFVVRSLNVFTVDASSNWWGNATGPTDAIGSPPPGDINLTGLGDAARVEGPPFADLSLGGPASLVYKTFLTAVPFDIYTLEVDITEPITSTEIALHETFSVCATITNVSDDTISDVVADISIDGNAILVPGEPGSGEKPVGSIAPGGSKVICWTLKCTGCGDVSITVTTTPSVCAPTKTDTVTVHQPAELSVVVDAPEKVCVSCYDWDVTATITNEEGMTATDVTATISWITEDDASWVSGGSGATGHPHIIDTIAAGESVDVVWTLHCDVGEEGVGKDLAITVNVTGTDCEVTPGTATVKQHSELMVVFQTPTNTTPQTTISTLQEFPVEVTVWNCHTEFVSDITVSLSKTAGAGTVEWWDESLATPAWAPLPAVQTIETLCPCCCEQVSWLFKCTGAGETTLTVTAVDGTDTYQGENGVTITQEVKAHLDAKQDLDPDDDPVRGFIMPDSDSTFGVCEDFVVMVKVVNEGQADALNVSGTLELGDIPKSALVSGEILTKTIALIPGSAGGDQFGTFVWKLHCEECGTEMIKVVDIGGTDANTGEAVLAANIDTPTPICPHQVGLDVEIISPVTCNYFTVSDTFCVDAILTNLPSPCPQLGIGQECGEFVSATLNIYGPAELVPGESAEKTIGIIPVGGTQEVEWTVHCAGVGDVKFTVTANVPETHPYLYERTSGLVIVHQEKGPCPSPELITTRPVGLVQGWNLISLPLIPEDPTIGVVLDGVDVVKVAGYSPFQDWKNYTPSAPSDLTQMNDGWGYWVDMGTAATTLINSGYELAGPPPSLPPYYAVVEGWNLIGIKSTTPKAPAVYLAGISGKWVIAYGFANGMYFLVGSPGHENLLPGYGYWIAITAPGAIYP